MTSSMNKTLLMTLIAAILLLNGCGMDREHRIRQAVLADPSTPEAIRTAIDNKKIIIGMTQDQVIAAWGLPLQMVYRHAQKHWRRHLGIQSVWRGFHHHRR